VSLVPRATPPDSRGTLERFLLVALGAVLLGSRPAAAQRATFTAAFFLEEARSGNVEYLGTGGETFRPDWSTRLGAGLGLRREGRAGQVGVQYGGYYEKYQTFSVLDHSEHTLGVDLASAPGRRSSFGFSAGYSYGQAQGNPASLEAPDRYLSVRTTRQALRGTLHFGRRISGRWSCGATGYGSRMSFHAISGVPEQPSDASVENRTETGASAGLRYEPSPRVQLGWGYGFTKYVLDVSGSETVHNANMSFGFGIGKSGRIGFNVGAFERHFVNSEGVAQPVQRGVGLQGAGGVGWTHTGRAVSVSVNADRSASSGGALMGTSTDTTAGVTVSNVHPIRWNWTTSARYALREPTRNESFGNIETLAVGGSVEWRFRELLAARVSASLIRQISGSATVNGSAPAGAIGLVWTPFGRDRGHDR
jgi:hypothetical protein